MEEKFLKCCQVDATDMQLLSLVNMGDEPNMIMQNYQRILSYFQNKNVSMEQIQQLLSVSRDNSSFAELASFYKVGKGTGSPKSQEKIKVKQEELRKAEDGVKT